MTIEAEGQRMKRVVQTAAALLIGSELLSGKTRDENLHSLAATLRALGIRLTRAVFVADEEGAIAAEIRALSSTVDVVFSSGGIGPTHDDVTIDALARAFDVPLLVRAELEALLLSEHGAPLSAAYQRMALAPEGAQLVASGEVRWPTIVMQNVWVLPGIPEIFRMKLAVVREHLRGPGPFFSRAVYTQLDEVSLKPQLDATVARFPDVEVGSYPKWQDHSYRTKVTFDAASAALANAALEDFCQNLPSAEVVRTE
jgi:molybdenum cofactor synthesis domain-containing protein